MSTRSRNQQVPRIHSKPIKMFNSKPKGSPLGPKFLLDVWSEAVSVAFSKQHSWKLHRRSIDFQTPTGLLWVYPATSGSPPLLPGSVTWWLRRPTLIYRAAGVQVCGNDDPKAYRVSPTVLLSYQKWGYISLPGRMGAAPVRESLLLPSCIVPAPKDARDGWLHAMHVLV